MQQQPCFLFYYLALVILFLHPKKFGTEKKEERQRLLKHTTQSWTHPPPLSLRLVFLLTLTTWLHEGLSRIVTRSVLPCHGRQEAYVPAFPVITGREEPLPRISCCACVVACACMHTWSCGCVCWCAFRTWQARHFYTEVRFEQRNQQEKKNPRHTIRCVIRLLQRSILLAYYVNNLRISDTFFSLNVNLFQLLSLRWQNTSLQRLDRISVYFPLNSIGNFKPWNLSQVPLNLLRTWLKVSRNSPELKCAAKKTQKNGCRDPSQHHLIVLMHVIETVHKVLW